MLAAGGRTSQDAGPGTGAPAYPHLASTAPPTD